MKAIQFLGSIPRYGFSLALGSISPQAFYGRFSNITLREIPSPTLPNEQWVKIKPYYAGICGSDINLIRLEDSPYTSPFASFPFTIGHENCGIITEVGSKVKDLTVGQRVVCDPLLPCKVRGVENFCSSCQNQRESQCLNFAAGEISPGLLIGACSDTGGSWSEAFTAHYSQVYPLPEKISWENAALIDTFASSIHPSAQNLPKPEDRVLIIGGGPIGLTLTSALRFLGFNGEIAVLAKYKKQGELALQAKANHFFALKDNYYEEIVRFYQGKFYPALIGKKVSVGGPTYIFDCIGSSKSIKDSLQLANAGGQITLIGLASFPKKIDWTPLWLKELQLNGIFAYSVEKINGQTISSYQLALNAMLDGLDLSHLLTHTYSLDEYKKAIADNMRKGKLGMIKAAFKID